MSEDGYLISEDTARLIARRIGGKDATPPAKPRSSFRSDGRITTFKNVSSETIPPYSVLMPVGVIEIDGTPVVEVDKYDGDYDGEFLFSWNFEVEYEDFGEIQKTRLVRVAYSGGTGEGSYAPESGEWVLAEGSEYVQGLGAVPDADTDQLMGIFGTQSRTKIGKADSDITYNGYGTVSIWRNGADTTEDIENVYLDWMPKDRKVKAGKEVLIQYFADENKWRIIRCDAILFPLALTVYSGSGSAYPPDWTYTVRDAITLEVLGDGIDPTVLPNRVQRPDVRVLAASSGIGYFNIDGELVIVSCTEVANFGEC